GFAIGNRVVDDFLAGIHEDAVEELHAGVVAELNQLIGRRTAAGVVLTTDHRPVVQRTRGHRLPVAALGAVDFHRVVAKARALVAGVTSALHNQTKLRLAAPTLVDVEAVVADVPDRDVLEVNGATPDLDAVIDVVEDLDVMDVGVATHSTK